MWIAIFIFWNNIEEFDPSINIEGGEDIATYLPPADHLVQLTIHPNGTVLLPNGTIFTGDLIIKRER